MTGGRPDPVSGIRMHKERLMTTTKLPAHDDDREAVTELATDIEGELRLHLARVHEFLDGTGEVDAITSPAARAQLLRISQILQGALSDIESMPR